MAEPAQGRKGWTRVAFGDVVRLSKERTKDPEADGFDRYVGLEHLDPGDLKVRRWGDVADGTTFTTVFRPGRVLFGKRRAYQRKVAVADFAGVCSGDIYVFESKEPNVLLPQLLPFICQTDSFFEHAIGTSAGSLSPRTNWKSLAKYEFALPPLEEQRRVARVMQDLQLSESSLEKLAATARSCAYSLLDRVFDPQEARTAANGSKTAPSGWVRLGDLAPLQPGYAFKSSEFSNNGVRLLRGSNVGVDETFWDESQTRYWPTSRRNEFADYVLNEDDIVIAMDRPFIAAGFKVARLGADDLPALLLQRVGRFLPTDESIREVVWAFVHSRSFRLQLEAQQEGTDLPHISKNQIDSTLVPKAALADRSQTTIWAHAFRSAMAARMRVKALRGVRNQLLEKALA